MNENEKPKPKTGFGYRASSIKEIVTLEADLEHNHYRKRERHRSDHCYAEITHEELGNTQSPKPSPAAVVTSSKRGETRSLLQTLVDSTKKANSPLPTPISTKPDRFVLPKSSPALFVTPGPGTPCLTPGGRSPYHSLFNSPKEDKFATDQTPLNRYSTNAIEGHHPQLSREDSAKRDAERLREIMQPHLVRKQQLNEDDSLQLAEAFSKVSPKKGKKRTSDGVAKQNVFVDDTPIPTRARSNSTASADGTKSTSGTPQKQKKKRKSASANTSSEDATNDATNDAPDFAGSPSKILGPLSKTKEKVKPRTKWQLLLDKTKQESKIEQRDINRASRVFREGK